MIFSTKVNTPFIAFLWLCMAVNSVFAIDLEKYIVTQASNATFPIASDGNMASIYLSDTDFPGVLRVAGHLQNDLQNVTGTLPKVFHNLAQPETYVIIVGTLGKSTLIDQLVKEGKIDAHLLQGKWEKFTTQIIENPFDGIKKALVIAGSDKRGTIYGMYDLSSQIGVSPWYFWSDVPVQKQTELHVLPGIHTLGEPKVKYRGIFINDEAPALTNWAAETYGGLNTRFYEKVFELILRLKGNYLWPAMWGKKFYVDDPQNGILADEYGIVMGTSHHEPLTRAHAEWNTSVNGNWDFTTNAKGLKAFWKDGMTRMGNKETLVTIGMRGDGDEPMSEATATTLLETIVKEQREIIADVTGKPAEETPQIWALYKEVQAYYDKGMKVPDDVTLLLCDDNWGNLRKLPSLDEKARKGGYGIYYHFDYVGGPRNYKWMNTKQIERIWEQMHLAYEHDVHQVWIVNVGDIKPMELPTEFFLDYAWNPEKWDATNLQDYYPQWVAANFKGQFTDSIAHILKLYTKYNARRTPELLDDQTYSLMHYKEAETVVSAYTELANQAQIIAKQLQPAYKDAFYQLILHPVLASANLHELYFNVAKNRYYAQQGRASANKYALKVKELFEKDADITKYYHKTLANGKWNHMMSQTHIGYEIWQEPKENTLPKTQTIRLANIAEMGVAIEGSESWWPNATEEAVLPGFNSLDKDTYYFDIFNRGNQPFHYNIKTPSNWINFSKTRGVIDEEERIYVTINWEKAPKGTAKSTFSITAGKTVIPIFVDTRNTDLKNAKGFVETNGYIAIDADHFSKAYEPEPFKWEIVDNLGKTGASVISLPVKKGRVALNEQSPKLSYEVNFQTTGTVKVHLYFSPTINYAPREGMYYGLSFDEEPPIQVNYDADPTIFNYNGKVPAHWHENVSDHIKVITTAFHINEVGNHTLNYYRVDEGLVLQKISIETVNSMLKETYLGAPESVYKK